MTVLVFGFQNHFFFSSPNSNTAAAANLDPVCHELFRPPGETLGLQQSTGTCSRIPLFGPSGVDNWRLRLVLRDPTGCRVYYTVVGVHCVSYIVRGDERLGPVLLIYINGLLVVYRDEGWGLSHSPTYGRA